MNVPQLWNLIQLVSPLSNWEFLTAEFLLEEIINYNYGKKFLDIHGYWHSLDLQGILEESCFCEPFFCCPEGWRVHTCFSLPPWLTADRELWKKFSSPPKTNSIPGHWGVGERNRYCFLSHPQYLPPVPSGAHPHLSNIHSPFVNPWCFRANKPLKEECFQALFVNT